MINYDILADSVEFYELCGFQRIESPWTITHEVSAITKPVFAKNFSIEEKNKVLVASGEQSFLYLYLKGFLPKGRFQTITPCFRDETFDAWHTKYFIKNELIQTDSTTRDDLMKVVNHAEEFLQGWITKAPVEIVEIGDTYDLVCNEIELGSYGIRSCSFLTWIYGTGVAEPRTSSVIEYIEKNKKI